LQKGSTKQSANGCKDSNSEVNGGKAGRKSPRDKAHLLGAAKPQKPATTKKSPRQRTDSDEKITSGSDSIAQQPRVMQQPDLGN